MKEIDLNSALKRKMLKILIVEDDHASALLLKFLMKDIANEILEVNNGIDAVDICLRNEDIDLIVMDLQMPGINGYETTEQIRRFNRNVIIIAQSAYAMVQNKEKALYVGCDDFITKPIQRIEFLSKINKYF